MDNVKKSFLKVKEDINDLKKEMDLIKLNLYETKDLVYNLCEILKKIERKNNSDISTDNPDISTDNPDISTDNPDISTDNPDIKALNGKNRPISIGNRGVSTDRQTNRQTDKSVEKKDFYYNLSEENKKKENFNSQENSVENAVKILNSLDNIKKELRLKFKRLTDQEFLVFSTIYQLDDEIGYSNYKILSERLNLTESSIRDYIGRLIKKGIPILKNKINNKNIQLNISLDFRKIISLPTILQLRDI